MKVPGEKIEVTVETHYKLAGIKCDVCGKIIEPPSIEDRYKRMEKSHTYYAVTTGHHDWGNDSVESIQEHDICPDCIEKFVADYLKDENGYRSRYIDIETEHVYYGERVSK